VQPIELRYGKIKYFEGVTTLSSGEIVYVLDTVDLACELKKLEHRFSLDDISSTNKSLQQKSVLVVDDSMTVRELERKILVSAGYQVTTAIDGIDGWNTLKSKKFDLIISDIDMPRLNGIELVTRIKQDPLSNSVPVIIVSYKEREEDRMRGLHAGADYYLTKSSFQNDEFLQAVTNLIGNS
jgi:two-component system sensor histidine kinase and response regulator WspE